MEEIFNKIPKPEENEEKPETEKKPPKKKK
jgi:hypothetical protein